jgi:membrane protein insertase Oxa1/YidC/SpoIIIJ
MKRLFASIALSLVGIAIFVVITIFGLATVGHFIVDEDARNFLKPIILLVAVAFASAPWVFAAHLTSEESWKEATKLLYFLPVFLVSPSFILPAIAFALVFTVARIYYIKREMSPYRKEVDASHEAED